MDLLPADSIIYLFKIICPIDATDFNKVKDLLNLIRTCNLWRTACAQGELYFEEYIRENYTIFQFRITTWFGEFCKLHDDKFVKILGNTVLSKYKLLFTENANVECFVPLVVEDTYCFMGQYYFTTIDVAANKLHIYKIKYQEKNIEAADPESRTVSWT